MPKVYGEKTMKRILPTLTFALLLALQFGELTYSETVVAQQTSPIEAISLSVMNVESTIQVVYEPAEQSFTPYDIPLSAELQEYLLGKCVEHNLDFELVLAIIQCESNFQTDVVSKTNDHGLMQINGGNFEWLTVELGVTDFIDAKQNIDAGTFILGELFAQEPTDVKALMMYNCGPTGAKRLWEQGIFSTTYTDKIFRVKEEIATQRRMQIEAIIMGSCK